jgi:hypothetical protein
MTDLRIFNDRPAIHRREAMKVLAAAGGALAAGAFLPARWSRPLVEAGVLPAHAQGSPCTAGVKITACPIIKLMWESTITGIFLTLHIGAQVSPACAGATICFTVQWFAGNQKIGNWLDTCIVSYTDGTCFGVTAASDDYVFSLDPRPTRIKLEAHLQDPELDQAICSTYRDIPVYLGN